VQQESSARRSQRAGMRSRSGPASRRAPTLSCSCSSATQGFRGRRGLEIGLHLFGDALDPEASPDTRLDATFLVADSATALSLSRTIQTEHVDVLLQIAFGADAYSALLRHVLKGRCRPAWSRTRGRKAARRPRCGFGWGSGITTGSQIPEDAPDHTGMSRIPRAFAKYTKAPARTIRTVSDSSLCGSGPQGRGFDSLQAHHLGEFTNPAHGEPECWVDDPPTLHFDLQDKFLLSGETVKRGLACDADRASGERFAPVQPQQVMRGVRERLGRHL